MPEILTLRAPSQAEYQPAGFDEAMSLSGQPRPEALQPLPLEEVAEEIGGIVLGAETQSGRRTTEALAPVERQPILEVKNLADLEVATQRLASGEIAGFFIPSEAAVGSALGGNFTMEERQARDTAVQESLQKGFGALEEVADTPLGSFSANQRNDIGWHTDGRPNPDDLAIRVHSTFEGGGRVLLARPGDGLAEDYVSNSDNIVYENGETLSQKLQAGNADERFMKPVIEQHDLSPGDTVVFISTGENPSWHRFETDERGRTSSVRTLAPPKAHPEIAPDTSGGLL